MRHLGVVGAQPPLTARHLPRRGRVALRALDDRVVARLAPVGEQLVVGVVSGHRLRQQRARLAARPVLLVAQAGVDLNHARPLAARPGSIGHDGRARVDGLVVIRRRPGRPHGRVEPIPDGHRERRPVHKVLRHEVAIVRPAPWWSGQVDLVKVVDDAVHWVEHGAVRIVLAAAVLVHQVVLRRVLAERLAADLVTRTARPVEAGCGGVDCDRLVAEVGSGPREGTAACEGQHEYAGRGHDRRSRLPGRLLLAL